MNPSRIHTPVSKEIDQWHFRFNQKTICVRVYLFRPRDAQCDGVRPIINFHAKFDSLDLAKAGIEPTEFAPASLQSQDINQLRALCEAHVQQMTKVEWEKVIVVGFANETEAEDKMDEQRREAAIELKFDYAVGYRFNEYFRHEDYDETSVYFMRDAKDVLGGYGWDSEKDIRVFDYNDELLAALRVLKSRYAELNQRVAKLLAPKNVHLLVANLKTLIPAASNAT
jgi:hypothetical protein